VYGAPCYFTFRKFVCLLTVLAGGIAVSCDFGWKETPAGGPVRFAVFDVGEGLAQAVVADGRSVLFDMGPPEEYMRWKTQFELLGRPSVEAVVLSHDHLDHRGGLEFFDSVFQWTGLVVVTPYTDTALIRRSSPPWAARIHFRTVSAGDTLALLHDVCLRCLWPPDSSGDSLYATDSLKNRYSTVFTVIHGRAKALITSDIDTVAERELVLQLDTGLAAELCVVPHHGSAGSLSPVFYGYIRPHHAVVSCGAANTYGHPSQSVLLWLSQMGVSVTITSLCGGFIGESDTYHWTFSNISE
jgi:competence protein ComEC